jgi:predicted transcriptional regulator
VLLTRGLLKLHKVRSRIEQEETAMAEGDTETSSLKLATDLTVAWLSNPNTKVQADNVATVLRQMHDAVKSLSLPAETEATAEPYPPAVTVRKSLASKDHILSLIDGKPYKMLRRHLTRHGLTPEDYRTRYGLKPDYPMVSETYAQTRSDLAKKIGLGRKPEARTLPAQVAPARPLRRRRAKKPA